MLLLNYLMTLCTFKTYAKQEFQKICLFTYSLCGLNNIIVTYSHLKISRWSKKYKRITFLQISYGRLITSIFWGTFIWGCVHCKSRVSFADKYFLESNNIDSPDRQVKKVFLRSCAGMIWYSNFDSAFKSLTKRFHDVNKCNKYFFSYIINLNTFEWVYML